MKETCLDLRGREGMTKVGRSMARGACVSLCLVHQAAPRPSPAQDLSSPYSEGAELRYLDTQVQRCEDILQQLRAVVPQMDMEGDRNIWIVKPGAKSRGRGRGEPLLPSPAPCILPPQLQARDVNSSGSIGVTLPGFESQLCYQNAVRTWSSYITSLHLSSLV